MLYKMSWGSVFSSIYNYITSSIMKNRPQIHEHIQQQRHEHINRNITIPIDIFLRETETRERDDVLKLLSNNSDYDTIRLFVPKYYSIYLLCHLVFDLLDILSNELLYLQTKIVLIFDEQNKLFFINEFKDYIKQNIPFIQKNKILPIYAKFIAEPDYHIEYTVLFKERFHILFLKESEDSFSIQRIYFSIDL